MYTNHSICLTLAIGMAFLTTASQAVNYEAGYTWNRAEQWTPGAIIGSTDGNPGLDSKGSPVWGYVWTEGGGLSSAHPWYESRKTPMVWDETAFSAPVSKRWARVNGAEPAIGRRGLSHSRSPRHHGATYQAISTWRNPAGDGLLLNISGLLTVKWEAPGQALLDKYDAEISIVKFSPRNGRYTPQLLLSLPRPAVPVSANLWVQEIPISLSKVRFDDGDELLVSVNNPAGTPAPSAAWLSLRDAIVLEVAGYGGAPDHIGVWRPSVQQFRLDSNGSGAWESTYRGDRRSDAFGLSTDIPVVGDWNGDGVDELGAWRPGTGDFLLDANGNGTWEDVRGGDILASGFGASTDRPVIGDWNGDGKDDAGYWSPRDGRFRLDMNGDGVWDPASPGDLLSGVFGPPEGLPVAGDWNGDGRDDVGIWSVTWRQFLLDMNGNGQWDGVAGGDTQTVAYGMVTDIPVIGDWNGDGTDGIGVWRPTTRQFLLDANNNYRWDGPSLGDIRTAAFGLTGDVPLAGRW